MGLITNKQETLIAIDILAKAYANAPNINWMFTQSHTNLEYFFNALIKDVIEKKGAYLTPNNRGVLLFYNLKTKHFSLRSICRKIYLILFITGIKKSIQIIRLQKSMRKQRPKTGMYGAALAIMNDEYKWQTRIELKKEMLLICKSSNLPVYAETTNRRIVLLYESLGFSTYFEMKHPYADLKIYFMKMDIDKI